MSDDYGWRILFPGLYEPKAYMRIKLMLLGGMALAMLVGLGLGYHFHSVEVCQETHDVIPTACIFRPDNPEKAAAKVLTERKKKFQRFFNFKEE